MCSSDLAFNLPKRPTSKEMGPLADRWRPYRAIAARLLWSYYRVAKSREGVLVEAMVKPAANEKTVTKRRVKHGR